MTGTGAGNATQDSVTAGTGRKLKQWFLYLSDCVDIRSGPALEVRCKYDRQPFDNGIVHIAVYYKGVRVEKIFQLHDDAED